MKVSLAVVLLAAFLPNLFSQNVEIKPVVARRAAPASNAAPDISVTSKFVLVPVHVTSRTGASVTGLGREAFTLLENRVEQPIVSFGIEDTPCSVGVILDLSGSMKTRLPTATSALHAFFATANPGDEAFLLTVSTRPQAVESFTSDFSSLERHLAGAHVGGATALNDTILLGVEQMRQARYSRRALLIVSDGVDNHSRYTSTEVLHLVEESDIQIYTIGVDNWPITKKAIETVEDQKGQAYLRTLTARTGGLNREIRDLNEVPVVAEKISRALRSQYLIGFTPGAGGDYGEWRTLQVKVNQPKVQIAARPGYALR